MESVFFTDPVLWIGYGAALFFCIFDAVKKPLHGVFAAISLVLVFIVSAYALIFGATLYELATVFMIFLLLNMGGFFRHGGNDGKNDGENEK